MPDLRQSAVVKFPDIALPRHTIPTAVVGVICLVFLYFYDPSEVPFMPKCPFLVLTGYKCPGCGTLRAVHALLHLHVVEALKLNPFLIFAGPVMLGLLFSRRFALNATVGRIILAVTVVYWILRNVLD